MSQEELIEELAERLNMRAFVHRELRTLPALLGEDERVLDLTQGEHDGSRGLIAVTDRRVMFVDDGIVRTRVEELPHEEIASVECSSSIRSGTLTILASAGQVVFENVMPRRQAEEVAELIRARMGAEPAQAPPSPPAGDPFETLRKLGELRDAGVLTQDEFDEHKRSILSRL